MATQHGGDLYDFSSMTDDEIRGVITEHLQENPSLDADWIDVLVQDGFVTLSGRVGTDGEVQVAEGLLHDILGITDYQNDLVVDELHRISLSEASDEATTQVDELDESAASGEVQDQHSDTAEHLAVNLEEDTFGTQDMSAAIRDGNPYIPPDRPQTDGYGSREDH